MLVGSGRYLVGRVLLTVTYHVPLNDFFVAVDRHAAGAPDTCSACVISWSRANHLRAATALGASGLLGLALSGSA